MDDTRSEFALWRRLAGELRGYRLHLAAILILNVASAPLSLLTPLPLKLAVDAITGSAPLPTWLAAIAPGSAGDSLSGKLMLAAAIVVTVALAASLLALTTWLLQAYTGERLTLDFRAKLFHRVQQRHRKPQVFQHRGGIGGGATGGTNSSLGG